MSTCSAPWDWTSTGVCSNLVGSGWLNRTVRKGPRNGFRIREAMIGWALATGDPDELIAVRQQNLALPEDVAGRGQH